jgi:hypothetical protein
MDWVVKSKTYKTTKDHDNRSFQEGVCCVPGKAVQRRTSHDLQSQLRLLKSDAHVGYIYSFIFFAFSSDGS